MKLVADIMADILKKHEVEIVFGYPGAAICPFFDSLSKSGIKIVLTRQEQNAAHAANGYARITSKVGVCAATSGPGALNLITGIATAYMDSVPIIAITGQVSSELIGRDVFQEADITGAVEPFVKHSYLVKSKLELPHILNEAFYIANSGRKGPVLIDVPIDIQLSEADFEADDKIQIRGYNPMPLPSEKAIAEAATALENSSNPLICVGGGVFSSPNAEKEIAEFAKSRNIPIVSTLMGLSAISPAHPCYIGMIGVHGTREANLALTKTDLLLLAGARVGDRAIASPRGICKSAKIIHIDIDNAELNKNIATDISVYGDVGEVISSLKAKTSRRFEDYTSKLSVAPTPLKGKIKPTEFVRTLCRLADDNAVIVADVGQHQLWSARGYSLPQGRFLSSGGMGTMGYSLPAAIGAALANKARQVIAICGDGGFQMNMMELATLLEQGLNIKLCIMNNSGLGMIRELQQHEYNGNEVAVDMPSSPSFTKLCEAYSIKSARLDKAAQIEMAISEMLDYNGAYLLECVIDKNEPTLQRRG